jgi:hypothetical protein
MKYFFHVIGDKNYVDESGEHLSGRDAAIARAAVIANELGADGDYDGFWIQIVDERGQEMGRVPVNEPASPWQN